MIRPFCFRCNWSSDPSYNLLGNLDIFDYQLSNVVPRHSIFINNLVLFIKLKALNIGSLGVFVVYVAPT